MKQRNTHPPLGFFLPLGGGEQKKADLNMLGIVAVLFILLLLFL
jgi:hypothetical protein